MQQIWATVAEDYAPFNVDVTTEDLGTDRIERSSSSDAVYGTRVLVTPSDAPFQQICSRQCGGVAYLNVFDDVGSSHQPAWVFPQALGNNAKSIAEAASHEAGHNLGLEHDGTATLGYYTGRGLWAPIMGVGYERPLVQWSAGSYSGANNAQDDLAILTGYLGARQDEASGSAATPSTLPVGEAVIGTRADVDAFVLGTCAADALVTVRPAVMAPNLDVRATLVDAAGVVRATDAPVSGFGDGTTATGLGASVTVPSEGEGWVLTVEGVGEGSWAGGGYDDYASLGAYTVSAPGCDGALADGVPGEPGGLEGRAGGTDTLTLTWSEPPTEGSGPVTGYVVGRSGSDTTEEVDADTRSHTFTGLSAGTTYELSVRAVNATGAGRTATVSSRTTDPAPVAPSAPRDLTGRYFQGSGQIEAYWTEPASTGTAPVGGYNVFLDGGFVGQMPATSRGVALTRTGGFAEGQYVVGVAAASSAGSSSISTVQVTVDLPDRPANDDVANATPLTGVSGITFGDNTYATAEGTDPLPPTSYAAGGYSVWYSWTPSQDGPVEMRTSGGVFGRDTTLAAYTGQPGALTQVAGADDTYIAHAGISYAAVAGTRYLVAVDGFPGTSGSGPFTLSWSQRVPQAPSAPSQVTAEPGDNSATVSWTAPDSNGSPITAYTVTSSPEGATETVTGEATTATVAGLTNGTAYTFTTTATNALGESLASAPSNEVTPRSADTASPVVSDFDFSPKSVEVNDGAKAVTVSVRLADATGAVAPTMILASESTSQTLGFGSMTRVSGDARNGLYERTVTVPTTAAAGGWSVRLYPVEDTLGNRDS
ncbi:fibronectin type III domain-containing protein, partial [Nocardioides salarius]|uniref:fibronectin type III domain-containing protein n=1 Tax=Nocardioides salarius TaxID=374513 RepID=UPI0030F9D7CA